MFVWNLSLENHLLGISLETFVWDLGVEIVARVCSFWNFRLKLSLEHVVLGICPGLSSCRNGFGGCSLDHASNTKATRIQSLDPTSIRDLLEQFGAMRSYLEPFGDYLPMFYNPYIQLSQRDPS